MKTTQLIIGLLLTITTTTMSQNIDEIIGQIKSKFAPDNRTSIFDISYSLENDELILTGEVSEKFLREELIKELKSKFTYKIKDEIEVLPSKKLGTKVYGLVNLSVANIRSKPDHPEELSTQALMGMPVRVLKEKSGWYLIQTPDEYLGWVDNDGIELFTSEEMIKWINSKKIIYTEFFGFVYSDKKFKDKISDIVAGSIVELIKASKNFFEVKLPDGRIGFIKKEEARIFDDWIKSLDFSAQSIIKTSMQMVGFPYLWGGTSIKGFDCSGFMKTIFFLNGIILPRDANQQDVIGDEVPFDVEFSELKEGDLIFFGRRASDTRPERITHVGMYIGNKKFIHSSGRVRIDSFDKGDPDFNEYRLNTIVRVKRFLHDRKTIDSWKIINNKFYKEEFYK